MRREYMLHYQTSRALRNAYKEHLRVNVSNFQLGPRNSEKTKNLRKFLKIALGEVFLKIYIFPQSDKYFERTDINLVSQLSDQILGV